MATQGSATATGGTIEDVATGQRMIILAILLNIVSAALRVWVGNIFIILALVAIVLAIMGLLRCTKGLGYTPGTRGLLVFLAFIPLVSIIMLAIISGRATQALKAQGYKVGLLGARNP